EIAAKFRNSRNQPCDPFAVPDWLFIPCARFVVDRATWHYSAAGASARPGQTSLAGIGWPRGLQLFLLPCHSKDQCSDRDYRSIHGAGVGAPLYGGSRSCARERIKRGNGVDCDDGNGVGGWGLA